MSANLKSYQEAIARMIFGPTAKPHPVAFTIPHGDSTALSAKLAALHEMGRE